MGKPAARVAVAECRRKESGCAARDDKQSKRAPTSPLWRTASASVWSGPKAKKRPRLNAVVKWAWQVHEGVLFLPGVHRKREHLDCYYLRVARP